MASFSARVIVDYPVKPSNDISGRKLIIYSAYI